MTKVQPFASGEPLAEALDRRRREARPVRVGLIGAGQMGTDIIVQTSLMAGIEMANLLKELRKPE